MLKENKTHKSPIDAWNIFKFAHYLKSTEFAKLNLLERLFWYAVIALAIWGATSLGYTNWKRYSANPTVVSLQKDFRNWKNPFPAVTGCFTEKTNERKANDYIYEKWGIKPEDSKYSYYMDFIKTVANISYKNLHEFAWFKNDDTLNNVDMLELAVKIHPPLSGTLVTFDTERKTNWQLIVSELGICFTVNSKFAKLLALKKLENRNTDVYNDEHILRCHFMNGLCYARYDSDPKLSLQYYVHSYLDVVHATSDPPLLIRESEELEINYRMQETISSPRLRYLAPYQRRCRFYDEPLTDDVLVYSTSICYVICRYRIAMNLCKCRPFFYTFLGGRVCDINGLICLSQHVNNISKPPSQIGCNCPQPCDIITYLPQIPKYTKWEHGYFDQRITFRWGLLPPTTKYHRDILFGFEDLCHLVEH